MSRLGVPGKEAGPPAAFWAWCLTGEWWGVGPVSAPEGDASCFLFTPSVTLLLQLGQDPLS